MATTTYTFSNAANSNLQNINNTNWPSLACKYTTFNGQIGVDLVPNNDAFDTIADGQLTVNTGAGVTIDYTLIMGVAGQLGVYIIP